MEKHGITDSVRLNNKSPQSRGPGSSNSPTNGGRHSSEPPRRSVPPPAPPQQPPQRAPAAGRGIRYTVGGSTAAAGGRGRGRGSGRGRGRGHPAASSDREQSTKMDPPSTRFERSDVFLPLPCVVAPSPSSMSYLCGVPILCREISPQKAPSRKVPQIFFSESPRFVVAGAVASSLCQLVPQTAPEDHLNPALLVKGASQGGGLAAAVAVAAGRGQRSAAGGSYAAAFKKQFCLFWEPVSLALFLRAATTSRCVPAAVCADVESLLNRDSFTLALAGNPSHSHVLSSHNQLSLACGHMPCVHCVPWATLWELFLGPHSCRCIHAPGCAYDKVLVHVLPRTLCPCL